MGSNAIYGVLLFAFSLSLSSLVSGAATARAFTPSFDFGTTKVRGVNLGGWLVLEPWITPSLFEGLSSNIIDELTFCTYQDSLAAMDTLNKHWDTWITEADFEQISNAGLNHVRIPVGYWAFEKLEQEQYIQGQFLYLNKSIGWAEKHNLKVIIDLHGAPGSQNGYDHSGHNTSDPTWDIGPGNIDVTRAVINQLVSMYHNNPVVSAISTLNEPKPDKARNSTYMLDKLKTFYYDSYGNIRYPDQWTQSNTAVILSDAFQGLAYWRDQGFMASPSSYQGVIMDTHKYQMFTDQDVAKTDQDHIKAACQSSVELTQTTLWTIVGEWSAAASDCAPHLNGRSTGARYDGTFRGSSASARSCQGLTGDAADFSDAYKRFLFEYWEAQASTYEHATLGWIAWTWKTERADEWSYQAGLKNGWIKRIQNKTATTYEDAKVFPDPAVCGKLLASAPGRFESRSYVGLMLGVLSVMYVQGLLW
ncbi:hypothetical protein C0992_008910 [Termitomyces sp. T32_za158]|nr:hypothetical protein C0992_008910 [Termitomyces sp. T32_za158]